MPIGHPCSLVRFEVRRLTDDDVRAAIVCGECHVLQFRSKGRRFFSWGAVLTREMVLWSSINDRLSERFGFVEQKNLHVLLRMLLFCGDQNERYERLSIRKLSLLGRGKEDYYEEVDLCCCWWFADLIVRAGRIQMQVGSCCSPGSCQKSCSDLNGCEAAAEGCS